jgi:hypothetical protein
MSLTAYKRLRRVTVGYCYRGLASDQLRKGLYWVKVADVISSTTECKLRVSTEDYSSTIRILY